VSADQPGGSGGAVSRTGVLFDIDGTLVDSAYLHALAWWQALGDVGIEVPMARVHRLIGMGGDQLTEELLGGDHPAARARQGERFGPLRDLLRPLPGAPALLREVHRRGGLGVLASSCKEEDLEALRKVIDAEDAIDEAVCSADAEASKPEPDIFAAALERGGLDAEHALVVGDSVWDIQAASKLDLRTIALLSGGFGEAELRDAGAVAVYDDPQALLDDLDGSAVGELLGGAP
jgi:HAD superfamily hydrolase (TIGR01509 family)